MTSQTTSAMTTVSAPVTMPTHLRTLSARSANGERLDPPPPEGGPPAGAEGGPEGGDDPETDPKEPNERSLVRPWGGAEGVDMSERQLSATPASDDGSARRTEERAGPDNSAGEQIHDLNGENASPPLRARRPSPDRRPQRP